MKLIKVSVSDKIEYDKITCLIKNGGNFSYFGDIIEWQKEQRKDRKLPFRN
jgi:hypothetical protein